MSGTLQKLGSKINKIEKLHDQEIQYRGSVISTNVSKFKSPAMQTESSII